MNHLDIFFNGVFFALTLTLIAMFTTAIHAHIEFYSVINKIKFIGQLILGVAMLLALIYLLGYVAKAVGL